MSRWIVRMLGVLLLLMFMFIFLQMYKQPEEMQRMQRKPAATSTTT